MNISDFSMNPSVSFKKFARYFIFKNILDKVNGQKYVFFEKKDCIFRIFPSISPSSRRYLINPPI